MAKRLVKVAKQLNLSTRVIVEFLSTKGLRINNKPTAKLSNHMYDLLLAEYGASKNQIDRNKRMVKSKKINKAVSSTTNIVESSTINKSAPKSKDALPNPQNIKTINNSKLDKKSTTQNPGRYRNYKLSNKQSELTQSTNPNYPDKMVEVAKKHIVGKRIYQIAQALKMNPKTLIRILGLKKSPSVFNFIISEKTWDSNMSILLNLYYQNVKGKPPKTDKISHKNKNTVNNKVDSNTGPKNIKNRIAKTFGRMTLEEKKEYESKREIIKRNNKSKKTGPVRINREPRIIYIGHPRY